MDRVYNQFHTWVKQDDFLTDWPGFIEQKNMDGLRDGYWITLWPKVNKGFTTNGKAIYAIYLEQESDGAIDESYAGWEDWVIYRLNATDDTPTYTLVSGWHITNIVDLWNDLYFFYKPDITAFNIKIAKISKGNANNDDWLAGMDEDFVLTSKVIWNTGIPPVLTIGSVIYTTGSSTIKTVNSSGTVNTFSFPDDIVVWMTLQWSNIVIYCRNGNIYFWDGWSTNESARTDLGSRISKVSQKGSVDYLVTEDGQFYIWSGYQFQRVTKPKQSTRMEDNSVVATRLDFGIDEPNLAQNRTIMTALDDVYMYSSDTTKGIYKYGRLIPAMQDGLHKIMTQNNWGTQIDYIYDMVFYERTLRRIYLSYKAWSTYWVDYIDLDSLETCEDAYMVSEVFSGWTTYLKELNSLSRAISNTSWSNYIKLYYRVNNGSWELVETINNTTDTISRRAVNNMQDNSTFKKNIDVQFKIELHNDTWWSDSPMLNEFINNYTIIKWQWS